MRLTSPVPSCADSLKALPYTFKAKRKGVSMSSCCSLIVQLNYGVVWYTASRRLADTLSALSEKVRGGPVWDQMVFAHMFTMPSSHASPWSGRHTLRVMDPRVFPNTCEDKLKGALFVHLNCVFVVSTRHTYPPRASHPVFCRQS